MKQNKLKLIIETQTLCAIKDLKDQFKQVVSKQKKISVHYTQERYFTYSL